MKYDVERKQLYCTLTDILNETSITSVELQEKFGDNFEDVIKKDLSRAVNRYVYTMHKGFNPRRYKRVLDALIFNTPRLQQGIRNAIVEHTKGAYYSGMDLNEYSGEAGGMDAKKKLPDSVLDELRIAGVYDLAGRFDISDDVLDELEAQIPSTGPDPEI